jgi:mono/diheme cytochrome c family protein
MLIVGALLLGAQEQEQPKTVIKHVPVKPTSAASGKEMYHAYCAVCHGPDGKGNGPAVPALKAAPPDLTMLAKNNDGKYPTLKVASVINGEGGIPAHGSHDMPVWGDLFWQVSGGHDSEVKLRVNNLNEYLQSLQAK